MVFFLFRSLQTTVPVRAGDFRSGGPAPRGPHTEHMRGARRAPHRGSNRLRADLQGVQHKPLPVPGPPQPSLQRPHDLSQLDQGRHHLRRRLR